MDWLWQAVVGNGAYGLLVAFVGGCLWWWKRNQRDEYFVPIVLTEAENFRDNVRNKAANYFSKRKDQDKVVGFFKMLFGRQKPISSLPNVNLTRVLPIEYLYHAQSWKELLIEVMRALRKANEVDGGHRPECWHVVLRAPALWSFAWGTMLNSQHALTLYHYQPEDADYHFIWKITREIKDQCGPIAGVPFEYQFLDEKRVAGKVAAKTECLLVQIGSKPGVLDCVKEYRQSHHPESLLRTLTRTRNLDVGRREDWLKAAAEIHFAICDKSASQSEDLYLFVELPGVLLLMAGDAIGCYAPRRIHLMQWDEYQQIYHEVLCLPDLELSKHAG